MLKFFMMKIFLFSASFLVSVLAYSTHIKGGQIQYEQISANTFLFTFIGYRDVDGVLFGNGIFDFGDGTTFGGSNGETIPWEEPIFIGNGVELWKFKIQYTYENSGSYIVSYTEDFRSTDIENIGESVSTSFYVEASLLASSLVFNSSPVIPNPDFSGFVGQPYLTTFSTVDPDGDSLSYHLVIPKQGSNLNAIYTNPNSREFYIGEPGEFSLSAREGNLVWGTEGVIAVPPKEARPFNVAIKVKQWRYGEFVGSNIIDFNIELYSAEPTSWEFASFIFPESRSFENDDMILEDTVKFDNPEASNINVSFHSNDLSFLINEMTIEDWNAQMQENAIDDEKFNINIQFDPEVARTNDNFSVLRMEVEYLFDLPGIGALSSSQSQTMMYCKSCDFDRVLNVSSNINPLFRINNDQIIFSNNSEYKQAIISDISGKIYVEASIPSSKILKYNFEKNTIYLLTLVSGQGITTRKFLIE